MRKLIAALAFLCLSAFSFGQTAVVTGHTITGQNTTSASGISILFELIGDNGQQCKVAGTGLITPYSSTVTQAQLAAGISLIENSQITCGTTTGATRWRYTIKSGGTGTRQCVVNITAATNLDSTACLNATSTPVTTTPTDSIYCRIDGSNCGFTGAATDTVSFGAPLFNLLGTSASSISNDGSGGVNITTNVGKAWDFQNNASLNTPAGIGIAFLGSASGFVLLQVPAVSGSSSLTLPAATDTLVGRNTTDTLTNKTLTTPAIGSGGASFAGSASGTSIIKAGSAASGTGTLPSGSGTFIYDGLNQTMSNKTLTAPAISDPVITGITNVKRIKATQATNLVTGDVGSLTSGWGSTASVSAVTGTDQGGTITISSSGTGQAANPTFTVTFHDGTWTTAPSVVVGRNDSAGPVAGVITTVVSATGFIVAFNGTPVAGSSYTISFIAMGTH